MPESPGFLARSVDSWPNLARGLILICLPLAVVAFAIPYLWRLVSRQLSEDNVSLAYDAEKKALIISPQDRNTAYLVVPASALWVDTGIDLEAGEVIHIDAIGHAHLSLKRLYEAVDYDSMPHFKWVGPEGAPFEVRKLQDSLRQPFLLSPRANIGRLLGYLQPLGSPAPSQENSRPGPILDIGSHGSIKNSSNSTSHLYLVLNEMVLDRERMDSSRLAYIGGDPRRKPDRSKRWNYIVQNKYWHLWFDDNIGQFLVQVRRHAS
jgi:hypothetical protein